MVTISLALVAGKSVSLLLCGLGRKERLTVVRQDNDDGTIVDELQVRYLSVVWYRYLGAADF
jgi:hypothetical protein